jgi:hypothetical protein
VLSALKRRGDDQRRVAVVPAERLDDQEVGDQRHLRRDHQGRQVEQEERLAAAKAQPGKGEGGQRRDQDLQHRDRDGDHRAVDEIAAEGQDAEDLQVVAEGHLVEGKVAVP